jgi:aspartyl-tRNA synthetase
MERTRAAETPHKVGKRVKVAGWVHARRDHGKLIFIDLRDASGKVQVVFGDSFKEHENAEALRAEWVVEIEGEISARPEKMVNPDTPTGTLEVKAESMKILARAEPPPIPLGADGYDLDEELRMKFRYLDLRRDRLQKNLSLRHRLNLFLRSYLSKKGFREIETPYISKSTPEGARDYVVPSRLHQGLFYALPQSPQQYKQLLMVAGVENYFQIVRCFRDEDTRKDRQMEFTQLDVEMSFVEREDVLSLVETLLVGLATEFGYELEEQPFPRISYADALARFGDDKFDIRKEKDFRKLGFAWVIDQPLFEWKERENRWDAMHHPFTRPNPEDEHLLGKGEYGKVRSWQYDLVCNGYEVGGGSIRITDPALQSKIFEIMGHTSEEVEEKFGHLLTAFTYGVPPHGGIALGLDRLYSILSDEPSIREVIAFPKTGDGRDLMMGAPSRLMKEQLSELGIEIKRKM